MLSDRNKELIGTVVGAYVVYRVTNRLLPFFVILLLIGMIVNVGQCTYHKITGAPPIVEPHVDRAIRRTKQPTTLNPDSKTSTPPTFETRYEGASHPRDGAEEQDLIGKIESALRQRDFLHAHRLIKKFTTVTGEECEAATIVADKGYIATAIVRLGRVVRDLNRLHEVIARSGREFRGKNAFVLKLSEATTMLKKLIQEMEEAMRAG